MSAAAPPAVDAAVRGLGYELVEMARVPGGVLRVTIDFPPPADDAAPRFIGVDDCEAVSRQLSHVLEVEGLAYERLEVSSPGLDRPLRGAGDFARFVGEQVEVTLKSPFQGRKHWRGELQARGEGWRVLLAPPAPPKGARRTPSAAGPRRVAGSATDSGAGAAGPLALDFTLAEVREARLVPAVDFKGRARSAAENRVGGPIR